MERAGSSCLPWVKALMEPRDLGLAGELVSSGREDISATSFPSALGWGSSKPRTRESRPLTQLLVPLTGKACPLVRRRMHS